MWVFLFFKVGFFSLSGPSKSLTEEQDARPRSQLWPHRSEQSPNPLPRPSRRSQPRGELRASNGGFLNLFVFLFSRPPDCFKPRQDRAWTIRSSARSLAGKTSQLCPSRRGRGASQRFPLNTLTNNCNWDSLSPHMFCSFLTRSHQPLSLFSGQERGPGPGTAPRRPEQSREEPR